MAEIEVLMLSKKKAAEYLGCSILELLKWVKPDRASWALSNAAAQL